MTSKLKNSFNKMFDWFKPDQNYMDLHKQLKPLDASFNFVAIYLLYSILVVVMFNLLNLPYYIGYAVWFILAVLVYQFVMRKYLHKFEKPTITYGLFDKIGKSLVTLGKYGLLSMLILIVYIVISNFIPYGRLSLSMTNASSSSLYLIPVLILTVVLQPLFEGIMTRGIITSQLLGYHLNKYLVFFIPVLVSVLLHSFSTSSFAIILFSFLTSTTIQYVRMRFGLINSIHFHMVLSLLLFTFFQM